MLVGGLLENWQVLFNEPGASGHVFIGELTRSTNDVIWRELACLKVRRYHHFAFRMKQNVYVSRGSNYNPTIIDRYDLNENRWNEYKHTLPYSLIYASVVVSEYETFAVIIGGYVHGSVSVSNSVIIFTEDEGVYVYKSFQLKNPRINAVSIRIK